MAVPAILTAALFSVAAAGRLHLAWRVGALMAMVLVIVVIAGWLPERRGVATAGYALGFPVAGVVLYLARRRAAASPRDRG